MKRILPILLLFVTTTIFAGQKKLPGTAAFWSDMTETITYGCYRVEVRLTDRVDYNVTGTVYISFQGKQKTGNLLIHAGEKVGHVDFDGLENGRRYSVDVRLNEPSSFPKR